MAITTYEIITYGGGEAVFNVLKGVSAIVGDTGYTSLQRLTLLVGFLWVIGGAAFNFRVVGSFTWLLGALLVIYIALIPKVSVTVIDKVDPKAGLVVQKAPLGLGVTAAAISQIGLYVTEAFERVYSLPSDQNYSENGMLFGMRLIQGASQAKLLDANTLQDFREFFDTCVLYDTAFGLYSWHDLQHSENLFDFFDGKTSKLRRFYINGQFETCQDGFSDLKSRLEAAIQEAEKEGLKSFFRSNQAQSGEAAARAEIAAMMQSSYNYLADLSSSSAELMRQNIMINTVRDAARGLDPVTSYAVSRAEAERVETWKAMGELSLRTLPLLKTVIEIILLAIFPIVILAALIAPKQVVTTYVRALIWLQLWAPLYAILHMILMTYTADAQGNQLDALTLANQGQLASSMAEMGYIAGYLAMSIPMIAYMLINQGGMMMANLAGGLMQGMQGIAQRGAEEATTGNISFGNLQQDNVNMFKNDRNVTDQSGVLTRQGADGNVLSMSSQGTHMENNVVKGILNDSMKASVSNSVKDAQTATMESGKQLSDGLNSTFNNLKSVSNLISNNEGQKDVFNQQTVSNWEQAHGEVSKLNEQFATNNTMGTQDSIKLLAAAGIKAPGFSPVKLQAQMAAEGVSVSAEQASAALAYANDTNFSDKLAKAVSAGHQVTKEYSASTGDTSQDQTTAQLEQSMQLMDTHRANLSTLKSAEKALTNLEERGVSASIVSDENFRQHLHNSRGAVEGDKIIAQARNGDDAAIEILRNEASDWTRAKAADYLNKFKEGEINAQHSQNLRSLPEGEKELLENHLNNRALVDSQDNTNANDTRVNTENPIVSNVLQTHADTDTTLTQAQQRLDQQASILQGSVENNLDKGTVERTGEAIINNPASKTALGAVGGTAKFVNKLIPENEATSGLKTALKTGEKVAVPTGMQNHTDLSEKINQVPKVKP